MDFLDLDLSSNAMKYIVAKRIIKSVTIPILQKIAARVSIGTPVSTTDERWLAKI